MSVERTLSIVKPDAVSRGLIGEIDHRATGNGKIVCRDGFTATTVLPEEFKLLARACGVQATLSEVDGSSLFCEMVK